MGRLAAGVGAAENASLCERCVEVLHVTGVGVSIMTGRNSGPVCSSSLLVRQLEDLQFSLGEGPSHDAYATGTMIADSDLAGSAIGNWPSYTPAAIDLGASAVFAFPLPSGADVMGVLTVYEDTVGMLTSEQVEDSRVLAQLLPTIMTAIQAQRSQQLLTGDLTDLDAHRSEVHQASGVTAVQLGIDVHEALVRIRAHAYSNDQTVAYVAGEIVARRLHLGDDRGGPHE
ncbi:MAG: hypothetical protein ACI8TP_001889 [Acidimicrobiales bacterium]